MADQYATHPQTSQKLRTSSVAKSYEILIWLVSIVKTAAVDAIFTLSAKALKHQ